jgi:hypothetical protein
MRKIELRYRPPRPWADFNLLPVMQYRRYFRFLSDPILSAKPLPLLP